MNQVSVAAVCGTEVRVYAPLEEGAKSRSLLYKKQFMTYGAARLYATEYDESQRARAVPQLKQAA